MASKLYLLFPLGKFLKFPQLTLDHLLLITAFQPAEEVHAHEHAEVKPNEADEHHRSVLLGIGLG